MPNVACIVCKKIFYTSTNGLLCSSECKKKRRSEDNKKYHQKNKERVNLNRRKHYKDNTEKYKIRDKKRYEKIKKEKIEQGIFSGERTSKQNLEKLSNEELLSYKEELAKRKRDKQKERYHNDELFSLKAKFRSRLNIHLRSLNLKKELTTLDFLGCDMETFKKHIESNFKEGMNWENRERWQVDHIVPISRAKNLDEVRLLSHYKNLQPMWSEDNLKKSNKLGYHNVTSNIAKKYGEKKGIYQQYRYEKTVNFNCHNCKKNKISKLITVVDNNWENIICNGCYGTKLT